MEGEKKATAKKIREQGQKYMLTASVETVAAHRHMHTHTRTMFGRTSAAEPAPIPMTHGKQLFSEWHVQLEGLMDELLLRISNKRKTKSHSNITRGCSLFF